MPVPSWLAATTGQTGQSAQINQFLSPHTSSWTYQGSQQAAETTGSGVYQGTENQYLTQSFTTGASQTSVGLVYLQISTVGGSSVSATIPPLTVSLYASGSGVPVGSAIATVSLGEQLVFSSPFWVVVPFGVSGLTASATYQIVVNEVGSASNYYVWQQSNQTSGAATAPDGVTWTPQSYGLMYQIYDQGTGTLPLYIIDDDGARITQLTYTATGLVSTLSESTVAQGGNTVTYSCSFTYTNGLLTGIG